MRLAIWMTAGCLLAPLALLGQEAQQPSQPSHPQEPSSRQIRASEKFYAQGVRATEKGDAEAAEKNVAKASQADPSNREYAEDWQIARQHAVQKLLQDVD